MLEKRKFQSDHIILILWNKLLEWVRICWGEEDRGEFRQPIMDLQAVSRLLFWAASTGPMVEDRQVGNRADPALAGSQKADAGASAGVGLWLGAPPEITLVYWLPRVRRHRSCVKRVKKITRNMSRIQTRIRKDWECVASSFCSHPPGFTITWSSSMVRLTTELIWTASKEKSVNY